MHNILKGENFKMLTAWPRIRKLWPLRSFHECLRTDPDPDPDPPFLVFVKII